MMRPYALLLTALSVSAQEDPSKTYNFLAIGVRQPEMLDGAVDRIR